jgi:hypothetical protein
MRGLIFVFVISLLKILYKKNSTMSHQNREWLFLAKKSVIMCLTIK